jgi:uroporphyrinogen decarboxylase
MPHLPNSRFLKALRREAVDATPVWFMRQAGRYMPEYRALREKVGMLESIYSPETALEITLQPLNAMNLDAGIIFSDILIPLTAMGLDLEFVGGVGPAIHNPVREASDITKLRTPLAAEVLAKPLEAIRITAKELETRGLPLIGFAGAPFTLASYAIEGGGSKNYERAKGLMYASPTDWHNLMDKLCTVLVDFLLEQAKAGASALQIFDSWGGALSPQDYQRFVMPYNQRVLEGAKTSGVPVIFFSQGTSAMLETINTLPSDALSLDWRIDLKQASRIAPGKVLQGNLDPITLFAPWPELERQAKHILERAPKLGHIFNLGHGILPGTPVDNVRRLADLVHEVQR